MTFSWWTVALRPTSPSSISWHWASCAHPPHPWASWSRTSSLSCELPSGGPGPCLQRGHAIWGSCPCVTHRWLAAALAMVGKPNSAATLEQEAGSLTSIADNGTRTQKPPGLWPQVWHQPTERLRGSQCAQDLAAPPSSFFCPIFSVFSQAFLLESSCILCLSHSSTCSEFSPSLWLLSLAFSKEGPFILAWWL